MLHYWKHGEIQYMHLIVLLILNERSVFYINNLLCKMNDKKYTYLLFHVSKFKEEIVIFLLDLDVTIYPFHGSMTLYKRTQFVKTYIQKMTDHYLF